MSENVENIENTETDPVIRLLMAEIQADCIQYQTALKRVVELSPAGVTISEGSYISFPDGTPQEVKDAYKVFQECERDYRASLGALDLYRDLTLPDLVGDRPTNTLEHWLGFRRGYTSETDREYPVVQALPEIYLLGLRMIDKTRAPGRMTERVVYFLLNALEAAKGPGFIPVGLTVNSGSLEGYWYLDGRSRGLSTDRVLVLWTRARYHDFNAIMLSLTPQENPPSSVKDHPQLRAYAAMHSRRPRNDEDWDIFRDIWWFDDLEGQTAELAKFLVGDTMRELREKQKIFGY